MAVVFVGCFHVSFAVRVVPYLVTQLFCLQVILTRSVMPMTHPIYWAQDGDHTLVRKSFPEVAMAMTMHTVFRMAEMILIVLLLIVPGCARTGHRKYFGVGFRNGKYFCSMRILKKSDVKFFAICDTEEEAPRACDVVTYYTNQGSSHHNFPVSVSFDRSYL